MRKSVFLDFFGATKARRPIPRAAPHVSNLLLGALRPLGCSSRRISHSCQDFVWIDNSVETCNSIDDSEHGTPCA